MSNRIACCSIVITFLGNLLAGCNSTSPHNVETSALESPTTGETKPETLPASPAQNNTTGLAASKTARSAEDELKALAGTWVYEKQVVEGREVSIAEMADDVVVIAGHRLTQKGKVLDGFELSSEFYLEVNPTTEPKRWDYAELSETEATAAKPGIYHLEDDRLTLCYNNTTAERPTSFESTPGSTFVLTVLRRKAKE